MGGNYGYTDDRVPTSGNSTRGAEAGGLQPVKTRNKMVHLTPDELLAVLKVARGEDTWYQEMDAMDSENLANFRPLEERERKLLERLLE